MVKGWLDGRGDRWIHFSLEGEVRKYSVVLLALNPIVDERMEGQGSMGWTIGGVGRIRKHSAGERGDLVYRGAPPPTTSHPP